MTVIDPKRSKEDDRFCAAIGPGVWLMDDHRWAFYVWAQHALGHASLLAATGASQRQHETIGDLVQAVEGRRLLLDIDLDVFNGAEVRGQSRLWPEEEIIACVDAWTPLIPRADVITIARSFGFSGTASDTVRLTDLVVPRVLARRAVERGWDDSSSGPAGRG